jgi:CBS domain containing-hemolysin-like protein
MPVYDGEIDNIRGLVLRSEILRRAAADEFDGKMIDMARKIVTCNYDDSVDKALDILLENKVQLMVVRDEFGGTVGLVTMEDVIETLLGVEIVDEEDLEAIQEGVAHENLRELAMMRNANGDEDE